ncbi:hypothetical protein [Streptomyces sp. NBC_01803]|uniref:hypothetical protein n=1 Tax=Streptomyces sp. NBC_01803 TaxID=2975946 RepID=UPI003FA3AEDB
MSQVRGGELTEIEDIVPAIRFQATEGWWFTGQTRFPNGGYTTRRGWNIDRYRRERERWAARGPVSGAVVRCGGRCGGAIRGRRIVP